MRKVYRFFYKRDFVNFRVFMVVTGVLNLKNSYLHGNFVNILNNFSRNLNI